MSFSLQHLCRVQSELSGTLPDIPKQTEAFCVLLDALIDAQRTKEKESIMLILRNKDGRIRLAVSRSATERQGSRFYMDLEYEFTLFSKNGNEKIVYSVASGQAFPEKLRPLMKFLAEKIKGHI